MTRQCAELCKAYHVGEVVGDHFAGEWVASAWRETGVSYIKSDIAKSQIYLELIPLFARGLVRLPDDARLLRELRQLERRSHRSGRDTVDHPKHLNDDLINAAAGALLQASAGVAGLWRRSDLLVADLPVPAPKMCDAIFVVLVAGQRDVAIAVWALSKYPGGHPLVLLDFDLKPFAADLFPALVRQMADLIKVCRSRAGIGFFAGKALANEARRHGLPCELIDNVLAIEPPMLALAASVHIGAGRVKVATGALEKSATHPFGFLNGSTTFDNDLPHLAALVGIACGLDEGR
ncbi:MAG: hypothetical protein WBE90_25425 [Xanthobacteraceae bacterium]